MAKRLHKHKVKELERENMFLEEALWEFGMVTARPFMISSSGTKRNYLMGQFSKIKRIREIN